MTTLERLDRWHRDGLLTDDQYHSIGAIARKERFSVFLELNALLYLGVIAVAGGLAWTVQTSFADRTRRNEYQRRDREVDKSRQPRQRRDRFVLRISFEMLAIVWR